MIVRIQRDLRPAPRFHLEKAQEMAKACQARNFKGC